MLNPFQQIGPYQVVKKIGSGGNADIFLAHCQNHAGHHKSIVLKCLKIDDNISPDNDENLDTPEHQLQNEAETLAKLNHPNIIAIFDFAYLVNTPFIVMEYLDGEDCHQLLEYHRQQGRLMPFEIAAYIAACAAAGLNYAHRQTDANGNNLNLVHRDISPRNIFFSRQGDVKIADFGIAKSTLSKNATQFGNIKGNFGYMSPEQAWGDRLDPRADIFSLGAVLYECTTNSPIYPQDNLAVLIDSVRIAKFTPAYELRPDTPHTLLAIITKSLDVDKKQRFQSAAELHAALQTFLNPYQMNQQRFMSYLQQFLQPADSLPTCNRTDFQRGLHPPMANNHRNLWLLLILLILLILTATAVLIILSL